MESTEMADDYDYLIKLLMIGDHGVGKDCLLSTFADESLNPITKGDCWTRTIVMDRKRIMLKIWEIVGQELYETMFDTFIPAYFVEAMGNLLVYDVTNESSFKNTRNYISYLGPGTCDNVNTILVGNKADMHKSKRTVPKSKGQALADEYGIKFFETSAKTYLNVEKVFFSIARDIKQRLTESDPKPESAKTSLNVGKSFFSIARDIKWRLFASDSKPEIKQLEDSQEQKRNDINETKESLKKAKEQKENENEQLKQDISTLKKTKEEKEVLSYENEQLKQHISTLKKAKEEKNEQLKQHISTLKKAKEEKEILFYENEQQLKQHISTLKYDLKFALLERDTSVKEAEELRNQIKLAQTSNFTWQELNKSTLGFSESLKIGEGGYGRVYKGNLRGTDVAIKVLSSVKTAPLSAFKQEVAILTTFRHPNLITLIGACYENSALVYEFLPNGSLENHLNLINNITPLTWQVRTRIMHEICLTLIFLHSNKPNIVIHGDLKPDNVLLDANFVSKLGDFGISRLIKQSDSTARFETKNIVGTPGYIDPDFICNGQLTEKSDVFSFGVIILRLLTGQSAIGVVFRVEDAMQSETLDSMIDKSAGEWPLDQAKELTVLGLRCTEMKRKDRPNLFNEVWPIFEGLQRNI